MQEDSQPLLGNESGFVVDPPLDSDLVACLVWDKIFARDDQLGRVQPLTRGSVQYQRTSMKTAYLVDDGLEACGGADDGLDGAGYLVQNIDLLDKPIHIVWRANVNFKVRLDGIVRLRDMGPAPGEGKLGWGHVAVVGVTSSGHMLCS